MVRGTVVRGTVVRGTVVRGTVVRGTVVRGVVTVVRGTVVRVVTISLAHHVTVQWPGIFDKENTNFGQQHITAFLALP